ncbi:MAG: hypothetical protein ACOYM1_03475 [Methylovulum sp.]|jgi:hypothetical protein
MSSLIINDLISYSSHTIDKLKKLEHVLLLGQMQADNIFGIDSHP